MRTLTRLALTAGAVSAAGVVGTALPAAAAPGHPAPTHGKAQAATPGTGSAKGTTARTKGSTATSPTTKGSTTTKGSRAKGSRTTSARTTSARTTSSTATSTKGRTAPTRTSATTARQRRVTGGRASANWSGYTQSARDVRRPIDAVSGSWRIPAARQHVRGRAEAVSDWVGVGGGRINGRRDTTLVQAGSTATVSRGGYVSYSTWYETLPRQAVVTPLAAHPGDRLSVAITRTGSDRWRVRLANGTTGRHWTTTVRYASGRSSADWITERPDIGGVATSLPSRSAVSYRNATVNGKAARFSPAQRVTMTDGSRAVSTPSGPESRGSGFSVCSYSASCG